MNIFYTVCIPCYNPDSRLQRLLKSIKKQNMNSEIEILLIDDCSENSIEDLINDFDGFKDLNIKIFKTSKNKGPGPARQLGIEKAQGEWITFIDQDDFLIPKIITNPLEKEWDILEISPFQIIKKEISMAIGNPMIVNTPFFTIDPDSLSVVDYLENQDNWIHGKFYKVSFLKEKNIHFSPKLFSHEDIYFSSLVKGVLACEDIKFLNLSFPTYYWMQYNDSLSHQELSNGLNYLENYFEEYVQSILYPLILIDNKYHNKSYLKIQLITLIEMSYFYLQGFKNQNQGSLKKEENLIVFDKLLFFTIDKLKMSKKEILNWAFSNRELYNIIREKATLGTGPLIEIDSFSSFINSRTGEKNEN